MKEILLLEADKETIEDLKAGIEEHREKEKIDRINFKLVIKRTLQETLEYLKPEIEDPSKSKKDVVVGIIIGNTAELEMEYLENSISARNIEEIVKQNKERRNVDKENNVISKKFFNYIAIRENYRSAKSGKKDPPYTAIYSLGNNGFFADKGVASFSRMNFDSAIINKIFEITQRRHRGSREF